MKLNSSEDIKPKLISLSWVYKQTVILKTKKKEYFYLINKSRQKVLYNLYFQNIFLIDDLKN
jgi:hypothetical protein